MPLRTKKWTGSKANQYISRSKACKKLQIALPSFRKLCILKGIYPHDPKKKHKKEGDRRVYYHRKDIKNLRREPILWSWRNQKTFRNKITKHKGRHNWDKVKRMQLNLPQVSIDHLVRERYPKFDDALRDLDDCATFIHLFASLPSNIVPQMTALRRMDCQKLCKEFRNYIASHGLLTKAFVSVKGIYYQCRFTNKFDVTWIVPHAFTHSIPDNVDYRVMSSFLDFYQTMFKFVVFKLYKNGHMQYPPFGAIDYDLTNLSLTELMQQKFTMKRKINHKRNRSTSNKTQLHNDANAEEANTTRTNKNVVTLDLEKILSAKQLKSNDEASKSQTNDELDAKYCRKKWSRANLFEDFKFLLNRETPQIELEFVILSMGGKVLFEQNCKTKKERNDPSITHQIVDRKLAASLLLNTREYVQPQWIFDCLNTGAVIPTQHYQIGVQCPPHLSPFVVYNDQSHIPSQHFVLEHWKKIAKQFGGFVPSKKLSKGKKVEEKKRNEEEVKSVNEDKEEEENVTMNLDIADIMNVDEMEENEEKDVETKDVEENVNGFMDEEEDEEDEDQVEDESDVNNEEIKKKEIEQKQHEKMGKKQSALEKQRIQIAKKERKSAWKKTNKHSLKVDGIPGSKEEWMKLNLARSMMAKKYRKTYDKIRRNKTQKSKHLKYMEQKRKRFEQKQMHTKH